MGYFFICRPQLQMCRRLQGLKQGLLQNLHRNDLSLMVKGDEKRRRLSYEELQLREGSGSEENRRSGQAQLQVSRCRLTCMYHTH
jgi:hypothetical protein